MAIDAYDNIYVSGDGFRLQYLKKTGNTWSPLEILDTIDVLNPSMAVSDDGNVFIAGEGGGKIELVTRSKETGLWHSEFISDTYAYPWVASVAEDDIVYVSWTVKYTDQIKIRMKYPNGTWSSVDSIPNIEGDPWISTLAVNEQGLHVVWNAHTEEWDYDIYYQLRTHEGVWKERQQVSFTESASLNRCVLLENNMIHIVWQEKFEKNRTSNRDIYYQILDITE